MPKYIVLVVFTLFQFFHSLYCQTTIVSLHPEGVETNEPCIAIDPNDLGTQILGSNTSFFFVSKDGGFTWDPKYLKPKEGFYGDPVVSISRKGYFYLCHLAKNQAIPWPGQFDRIVFEKSTDRGNTFTSIGVGQDTGKVQDKPWFYVDESKKSKFRDRIYLAWTEFDKYGSRDPKDSSKIRFAHSDNFGDTFSKPVIISDESGDAADDDNTLEGATIATGIKGELYTVWAGKGKIWLDMSLDGGKTWGKDRVVADQKGSWNTEDVGGIMRSNSMPFIVADKKGRIFIIFGDNRNGDQDVFYIYSKDRGKTFSQPIRINNDNKSNKRDQYMPAIFVDRKKNKVYATWYDRRNSEFNRFTDVYLCELRGNKPGKNIRITNEGFCVPGKDIFFGDYISLAAASGEIRVAYTSYDADKMFATVKVGILVGKMLKRIKSNEKPPSLQLVQLQDTNQLYIHLNLPRMKSCTLEMKRGDQIFYKELFNPITQAENEVMLPLIRFSTGVYHVTLSSKGRKMEQDFYIERH